MTHRSFMRNRDSTALFLFDMLAFSRDAIALSRGRTRADLDSDLALRLALTHLIQIIGEAAGRLPDAFKLAHSEIPWRRIAGMRNRIVHDYWRIESNVVWEVVQADLPALAEQLEPLVPNKP